MEWGNWQVSRYCGGAYYGLIAHRESRAYAEMVANAKNASAPSGTEYRAEEHIVPPRMTDAARRAIAKNFGGGSPFHAAHDNAAAHAFRRGSKTVGVRDVEAVYDGTLYGDQYRPFVK